MCGHCNTKSKTREIFLDMLTNKWYINHRTSVWDEVENNFLHDKIYINYCPWCGKKLFIRGK